MRVNGKRPTGHHCGRRRLILSYKTALPTTYYNIILSDSVTGLGVKEFELPAGTRVILLYGYAGAAGPEPVSEVAVYSIAHAHS